jgi:hypothetical protein
MAKKRAGAVMDRGGEIAVEYVPLDDVRGWHRNPKGHDVPEIMRSMKRWGFTAPIMKDGTTDRLVAGHGRLEALIRLRDEGEQRPLRIKENGDGQWLVPVLTGIGFDSESEAEAYLIADNRLTTIGGWSDAELSEMLNDLDTKGVDLLSGLGFNESALREVIAAGVDFGDFIKPDVVEPDGVSSKAPKDAAKDGNWFYVEFYGDDERYAKMVSALGDACKGKQLDPESFARMVELYNEAEAG